MIVNQSTSLSTLETLTQDLSLHASWMRLYEGMYVFMCVEKREDLEEF